MNFNVHLFMKDGHKIRLYEVAHVGDPALFTAIHNRVSSDYTSGSVIHHEGVKLPEGKFLGFKKLYSTLAEATPGLAAQTKPSVPFSTHDIEYKKMSLSGKLVLRGIDKLSSLVIWAIENNPEEMKKEFSDVYGKVMVEDVNEKKSLKTKFIIKSLSKGRDKIATTAAMESEADVSMIWGKEHAHEMTKIFARHGYKLMSSEAVM